MTYSWNLTVPPNMFYLTDVITAIEAIDVVEDPNARDITQYIKFK